MALTAVITNHWSDGKRLHAVGFFTGTYLQDEDGTGGSVVNWGRDIKSPSPPLLVQTENTVAPQVMITGIGSYLMAAWRDNDKVRTIINIFSYGGTQVTGSTVFTEASAVSFYAIFHQFR